MVLKIMTERQTNLHGPNEILHNLHTSAKIIRTVVQRGMRWTVHSTCIGKQEISTKDHLRGVHINSRKICKYVCIKEYTSTDQTN